MDKITKLLMRNVSEVIIKDHLKKRLEEGGVLRVKYGADPTAPDLHLGHMVALRKLKEFQDLGHKIIFIIGDYTAKIGDPSGKSKTRPPLSDEEIKKNAKTYFDQVGAVLDLEKIEIRRNSEWLSKKTFADIIELVSKFSVQRILERDDFTNRLKNGLEIGLHELFYPVMQAYDSVEIKADIELGGTDQLFNMLSGRDLQRKMGLPEQDVITVPLLVGTDGEKKMSKSLGNYIGIFDAPEDMYGKVMSIPDRLMIDYFKLCSDFGEKEIDSFEKGLKSEEIHPRDLKMKLSFNVVEMYHGVEKAKSAEDHFKSVFQKHQLPEKINTFTLPKSDLKDDKIKITKILAVSGLAASTSEARRLIEGNGVKIDGDTARDPNFMVDFSERQEYLFQVGKRKFLKMDS